MNKHITASCPECRNLFHDNRGVSWLSAKSNFTVTCPNCGKENRLEDIVLDIEIAVEIQITRYAREGNPGVVECRLTDAWGKEWLFEKKLPYVENDIDGPYLNENSDYPQPGSIQCKVVKRWRDDQGREIASIDTAIPWHVPALDGTTEFDVLSEQLTSVDRG